MMRGLAIDVGTKEKKAAAAEVDERINTTIGGRFKLSPFPNAGMPGYRFSPTLALDHVGLFHFRDDVSV